MACLFATFSALLHFVMSLSGYRLPTTVAVQSKEFKIGLEKYLDRRLGLQNFNLPRLL